MEKEGESSFLLPIEFSWDVQEINTSVTNLAFIRTEILTLQVGSQGFGTVVNEVGWFHEGLGSNLKWFKMYNSLADVTLLLRLVLVPY